MKTQIKRGKWQRTLLIVFALFTILSLLLSACAVDLVGTGGGLLITLVFMLQVILQILEQLKGL